MGRIIKRFSAKANGAKITADALVDTGADRTVLGRDAACALGLDIRAAKMAAATTKGGRISGFEFPARIIVGDREADLDVFVPIYRGQGKQRKLIREERYAIGHDFLQKTKAQLDYSRPHEQVFQGLTLDRELPVTRAEAKALRALPKCALKKRRR